MDPFPLEITESVKNLIRIVGGKGNKKKAIEFSIQLALAHLSKQSIYIDNKTSIVPDLKKAQKALAFCLDDTSMLDLKAKFYCALIAC